MIMRLVMELHLGRAGGANNEEKSVGTTTGSGRMTPAMEVSSPSFSSRCKLTY